MSKKPDFLDHIQSRPRLSLVIGGVIIVIGILISDLPKMFLSLDWPTTEGTIIDHTHVGQKFEEYDGEYYTNIEVYIRYGYSVQGDPYTSLTIDSIDRDFDLYPQDYADRYPVGEEVMVYYNPKNPAEAVLEPGFVYVHKAFDIYSYLVFGLGIYFIHLGISKIKDNKIRERLNIQ